MLVNNTQTPLHQQQRIERKEKGSEKGKSTYDRDDVGDTITRVNNGSGQGLLADFARGPGGSQGENSLDSNVQSLNIERLEHNLGSVLTVLWRVQWGLSLFHRETSNNKA